MSEVVETVAPEELVFTEVTQTDGRIPFKAYNYKVTMEGGKVEFMTVLAPSSYVARMGMDQHFPGAAINFIGKSNTILQFNG